MKILLIQPVNHEVYSGMYNLVTLAAHVENYAQVKLLDTMREPLATTLLFWKPDIVGLTAYTVHYPAAIKIAEKVKQILPSALRVLGGVHITCLPESLHPIFHLGIMGEGEETLEEVCRTPREGLNDLYGVCFHHGDSIVINVGRSPPDVENLPVPKQLNYISKEYFSQGITCMIGSRGCPFRCEFCYSKAVYREVRYYPVERVVGEMKYQYKKMASKLIIMWDDTFVLDRNRLAAMREEMKKQEILGKVNLGIHMRTSVVDEDLMILLKGLGVSNMNVGLESGSNRVLEQVKGKGATVEKHKECIELGHKYGINVDGSFIFGMPGEKIEDMKKTLEFMEWLHLKKQQKVFTGGFWIFVATPLPGTSWWRHAIIRERVSPRMDWSRLSLHNWKEALLLDEDVPRDQFYEVFEKAKVLMKQVTGYYAEV